jgi:hypothetical protein
MLALRSLQATGVADAGYREQVLVAVEGEGGMFQGHRAVGAY